MDFFADSSFSSIGVQSPVLLDRLASLGLKKPTSVQASAYPAIAGGDSATIGSETGSGKTLAYLLPLMDDILQQKVNGQVEHDYARAIILVPNKELVGQVTRMAMALSGGPDSVIFGASHLPMLDVPSSSSDIHPESMIRLAILPGGLNEPLDFRPFRESMGLGGDQPPPDLVISTPASLAPLALKPKHIDLFADVQTLVVDEADMLLDGGYIRDVETVLMGFRRADRLDLSLGVRKTQHVFVAATLPDAGLRSVDAWLEKKFPAAQRVVLPGMHNARHYGLAEATQWTELESKKERMQELVRLLQTPVAEGGLQEEKVMVFLNSVEDVEGVSQALVRADHKALPYHAKLSLADRTSTLDRFRRYTASASDSDDDAVGILVCTDLASRGLDIPGVGAVVQLQFAGNVVAHLHRMGRCGRAGQRRGRGIVYYGEQERELVEVVRQAEELQDKMVLEGDVDEIDVEDAGKVEKAFSRKRGFTKKRKKLRREGSD